MVRKSAISELEETLTTAFSERRSPLRAITSRVDPNDAEDLLQDAALRAIGIASTCTSANAIRHALASAYRTLPQTIEDEIAVTTDTALTGHHKRRGQKLAQSGSRLSAG